MTVLSIPAGIAWVAVLALAIRLLPASRKDRRLWVELLLVALCGGGAVLLGGFWTSSFFLPFEPAVISTPDFDEYCGSIAHVNAGEWYRWSPNRSLWAGWPAVLASSRVGVVDGLLVGAWVGQALLGAGLYAWGRAVHSRTAGIAAAAFAASVVPLAVLGRTLTFYPMLVGTLTFSTGLVATAWRWPSPRTFLLGGAGIALSLLIDLRGVIWGLSLGGMLLLAALAQVRARDWRSGLRRVGVALAAASLPVCLAWAEADRAYLPQTTTLEDMGNPIKGWDRVTLDIPTLSVPMTAEHGYIWGKSSLLRVPDTLLFLRGQSQLVPDVVKHHPNTIRGRTTFVDPYLGWAMAGAILAALSLIRTPGRLLLLVGTCVPFVAVLRSAIDMRFSGLRFLSNGAVVLPLCMGIGVAVLAGTASSGRSRLPWRTAMGAALSLAIVFGVLHTDLSPVAVWRTPVSRTLSNTVVGILDNGGAQPGWGLCQEQVNADRALGQPRWLYQLSPFEWQLGRPSPTR